MTYLKLVLVAAMWGGTFIATRIVSQSMGSFTGASLRYLVALLFMLPLMYMRDKNSFRITRKQFYYFALLGSTGIFAYSYFFFNGMRMVEASHASLIVAINPVLVLMLSSLLGKEKLNGIRVLGLLLSLAGTTVVISRGHPLELFSMFTWGDAFLLGCPVSWAFYTYFAKDVLHTASPVQTSTWATIMGFIMLLVMVPFEPMPAPFGITIWIALFYLGFCGSLLGLIWYYEGVKKLGPVKTSAFNNLIPVFALLFSVLILGETLHSYTLMGAILVIGGVFLINRF